MTSPTAVPFASSLQHLLAELERIDLRIRVQVWRARQLHQRDEEFQGLYISEQEIDELLARPLGMPGWAVDPDRPDLEEALGELAAGLAARRAATAGTPVRLRLDDLRRRFGLSDLEVDVLLIALAPEIDLRYERLFAYLQDDVTRRRPSVDLALNLLCPDLEAKLAARARFAETAPLLRHRLVRLFEDPSRPQPPLLARYLKVEERVASYLLGSDELDPRLSPFARRVEPAVRLGDLVLPDEWRRTALGLASSAAPTVLYLQGPYGVGKQTVAEALCREAGLGLLAIDLERLLAADDETFETALDLAAREAILQNAAPLWQGFDGLLEDDRRGRRARFLGRVADSVGDRGGCGDPALAFLAGNADWEPSDALHEAGFVRLAVPLPDARERAELWRQALAGTGPEDLGADVDLDALAVKFRFTAGQIRDAAATARSLARARDPHGRADRLPFDDLLAASRLQSNPRLAALAQKIAPRYGWDDIVLPRDRKEQLREICNTVRYRARVYEEWGFGRKLAMGKGVNILFAGPSGTGKTMAAEIIAGELGLDLYRIDLSTVVSKYIGETEKNLSKVFAEAETSNAVLFFDEADALFGKRSEVRDAHDRYANLEISYLLQRMEAYEGVVILATNLRKNMDDAFVRRLHFAIEFPFPSDGDRLRIWSGLWPEGVPRSPEVDLEFLAQRFEIPGGNIRNIAVAATFLAAADGGVVTMAHLIRALQREYQKMGKVTLPGEFGEYAGFAAR